MKYYQFAGESDQGVGSVYMEVDLQTDTVVRQVENYGDVWRWGSFDGTNALGHVADRYASELSLQPEEEISKELFEQMWKRAGK